jgi:RNA polymerase sigma-70 factor (ECF subfamily)
MDDRELTAILQDAQRHETAAFDRLYAHYADALYYYLYARCGEPMLAEELTSDLWLAVVERLPSFRIPTTGAYPAFSSWLYTIARYTVIRYYRQRKHLPLPLEDTMPANDPAMEEHAARTETHAAVRSALAALTPEQREVIVLRFYGQRSSAEVAALTGRSPTAIKALQHRAVVALGRILGVGTGKEV